MRNVLYLASVGLAVHLILPQIPGLERSARLVADAAPVIVCAAFLAEVASEACYAELLGRSVAAASRMGTTTRSRSRRGLGFWFMLRLTVCGYGAAHVLPGGGAAAATVTYGALRTRGVDRTAVGLAVAAVSGLVYGALGVLFSGSLLFMLARGDLTSAQKTLTLVAALLVVTGTFAAYVAYRRPRVARRRLVDVVYRVVRIVHRRYGRQEADELIDRLANRVDEELRSVRRQVRSRPLEVVGWCCLAFGYWVFDALCLILVFLALGVPAGAGKLFVAYGIATAAGALPLTPGGIGVFEATMLATLAVFGIGSEAAIPVLGYRLFNFWMPIPLSALLYPTMRGTRHATSR